MATAPPAPLTVTQLNGLVRDTLDTALRSLLVVGEISNFRIPSSGHFYFCLKDKGSQIAAVMFRSANQLLPFRPADGMEVMVRGRVGIYEVRGDLQFYVEQMEPCGVGSAQLALVQLKQRLAAAGLFAEERKRALPAFPRLLGIVTALRGAALHDMLVILRQRMPGLRIIVRPVRVQGKEAPLDIQQALHDLTALSGVEVIIVGRGGGSAEDLSAFNDERVAHAIARCPIPVVSAVGHEIDITIADLVADRRAPTPTAAAALVVPHRDDLLEALRHLQTTMQTSLVRVLRRRRERLHACSARLRDPRQRLKNLRLRLDDLNERAGRAMHLSIDRRGRRLAAAVDHLNALSPLAVLERGYSLSTRLSDAAIVRDAASLQPGDDIEIRFARGQVEARVTKLRSSQR